MTIAEELMKEELDAHGHGDIYLCVPRINILNSAIAELKALEAKIAELEKPLTCDTCEYSYDNYGCVRFDVGIHCSLKTTNLHCQRNKQ